MLHAALERRSCTTGQGQVRQAACDRFQLLSGIGGALAGALTVSGSIRSTAGGYDPIMACEAAQETLIADAPSAPAQAWTYKKLGFPIPYLVVGRWGASPLPRATGLRFVIGEPIAPPPPPPTGYPVRLCHMSLCNCTSRAAHVRGIGDCGGR